MKIATAVVVVLVVTIVVLELVIKKLKRKTVESRRELSSMIKDNFEGSIDNIYELGEQCNESLNRYSEAISQATTLVEELNSDSDRISNSIFRVCDVSRNDLEIKERSDKQTYNLGTGMRTF